MQAQTAYGKMAKASAGKQLTPKMGPQTPEEFALRRGGEFADNARRVKAAPEKLIPVGRSDTETGRITGREYELVVSPKVAYREHKAQFEEWAKQFPKEAASIRTEAAKEFAAEAPARKAAATAERIASVVAQGRIPLAQEVGVTEDELFDVLDLAGVTADDYKTGTLSRERASQLAAALKPSRGAAP
jgi:hypothetical protein